MPTDDERREIATKLRDMAVRANPSWPALMEALKCPGRAVAVQYLADLIDPTDETCEADLTDVIDARVLVREYECSKCGMSWETVWAYDFAYCPYCGRLIEHAD